MSWTLGFEDGAGPRWMRGREATVFAEKGIGPCGRPVAWRTGPGPVAVAVSEESGRLQAGFDVGEALDVLLSERYRRPAKPITRLLPFHYHRVPGALRFRIGQLLSAGRRSRFPRWPIDPSGDALRWLSGRREVRWPGGKAFALVLTHDVDSAEGMARASRMFDIEAAAGLPAVYGFVTSTYEIDRGLARAVQALGGEIAWHSDLHDNRIAFEEDDAIRRRIEGARGFLEEFNVTGFRSPSLYRTPALFRVLAERFRWDSSVPDTGPGGGCASVVPFRLGRLLELPLSMPQDADLLFRRRSWQEIVEAWLEKVRYIREVGGLAVLNTHPEPHFSGSSAGLEAYGEFLVRVRELDPWIAVPRGMPMQRGEVA
ncbi:MAG: hypothetical protein HYY18_13940 [Planctomycetes bacterium]|nr:hypothetical protein [Planctomycetota bacterium]